MPATGAGSTATGGGTGGAAMAIAGSAASWTPPERATTAGSGRGATGASASGVGSSRTTGRGAGSFTLTEGAVRGTGLNSAIGRDPTVAGRSGIAAMAAATTAAVAATLTNAVRRRLVVVARAITASAAASWGRVGTSARASWSAARASSKYPASAATSARNARRSARRRLIRPSKLCHSPVAVWDTITGGTAKRPPSCRDARSLQTDLTAAVAPGANRGSVSLLRSTHRP